jgi:hypothetical protein
MDPNPFFILGNPFRPFRSLALPNSSQFIFETSVRFLGYVV